MLNSAVALVKVIEKKILEKYLKNRILENYRKDRNWLFLVASSQESLKGQSEIRNHTEYIFNKKGTLSLAT